MEERTEVHVLRIALLLCRDLMQKVEGGTQLEARPVIKVRDLSGSKERTCRIEGLGIGAKNKKTLQVVLYHLNMT